MKALAPPPGVDPMLVQQKMAEVNAQVAKIPPMVSTVPVDEELDDHVNEMGEIMTWANTAPGIKARAQNPNGFANVRLHYDEHKSALAAKQAGNQNAPQKPISESINFKDLPPSGQVQLAAKGGIQLNPQELVAEQAAEVAAKAAPAANGNKPPQQQ